MGCCDVRVCLCVLPFPGWPGAVAVRGSSLLVVVYLLLTECLFAELGYAGYDGS